MRSDSLRRHAASLPWIYYLLSVSTLVASVSLSAKLYPGDYDWQYTVISALASPKHNPDGYRFLSIGLAIAMAVLIPFTRCLAFPGKGQRRAAIALQGGLGFGILMGIESFFSPEWPEQLEKLHELLALLCFLLMYGGVLAYSFASAKRDPKNLTPSIVISAPLIAIGICQLSLYLGQRDLGWVDQSWREMGIPLWQSFAFWQWIALACLWASLGLLRISHRSTKTERI